LVNNALGRLSKRTFGQLLFCSTVYLPFDAKTTLGKWAMMQLGNGRPGFGLPGFMRPLPPKIGIVGDLLPENTNRTCLALAAWRRR
jgi:hypothetical protein